MKPEILSASDHQGTGAETVPGRTLLVATEPAATVLRFPAVRERTGLSRATVWRLERRGDFPKHIRLSSKAVGWLDGEITDWIRSERGGHPVKPSVVDVPCRQSGDQTRSGHTDGPGVTDDALPLEEQHYSVPQLADRWGLSGDFVRRLFAEEPGVTEWVHQARGRRRYRVFRIPQSVAERVYRRAVAAADPHHPTRHERASRRVSCRRASPLAC